MDISPKKTPSGKKATGYGEIMIKVWFTGTEDEPFDNAEAAIHAPREMPFPYFIVAGEHLITAIAMKSDAGYERAIELLVEGAMSNKGKLLPPEKET